MPPKIQPESTARLTRRSAPARQQQSDSDHEDPGPAVQESDSEREVHIPPRPTDGESERIRSLEKQVADLRNMISSLAHGQQRMTSLFEEDRAARTATPRLAPEVVLPSIERATVPRLSEAVRLPPTRNTRGPSLPALSRLPSEESASSSKKSTISEKITPLSDGLEHTFLQWSASIRDRLVVNEDHYPTDVSRRALIWSTTTGLAKTYLEPQYLSDSHPFESADEMMDLLGSYFLTGNESEQARNLFDDLHMGEKGHASETFPEFKARFQSAAITGQVANSEWFRYMWNKLTPQLRSRVAVVKSQWKGDYHTMVRELTAFDLERRRNNELNPLPTLSKRHAQTPPTRTTHTPLFKPKDQPPRHDTPALGAKRSFLPREQTSNRLRVSQPPAASGNCFKCGKPGHFQDKCPLNASVKEIQRLGPESEDDPKDGIEESGSESEESLEENEEA